MTDHEKSMIKNVATGCASSIYNSVDGSTQVIVNITVRATVDGTQSSHVETVTIDNGV